MTLLGWLDAGSGISGDMLLGACVDAGVPMEILQRHIDLMPLHERVEFMSEHVMRGGLGGTRVRVEVEQSQIHRRLADVLALLEPLDAEIRTPAAEVFLALATAEASVHRVSVEDVHFHEVGALDSIADVVGVIAAFRWLGINQLVCSPIALGGGHADSSHGRIPVPGPAVMQLLARSGVPAYGGPVDQELATPTGVALAITLANQFGPMPPMVIDRVGSGAGSRDPVGHANVVRLVVGNPARLRPNDDAPILQAPILQAPSLDATILEANVDDMDPRLWPGVIAALMDAGAADAWLTPILMKKGRPAHTVSVLTSPDRADSLVHVLLTHTSTIGLRRIPVEKVALPRETAVVEVGGLPIRIKIARFHGAIANLSAEFEDVARVAAELGRPQKHVAAEAMRTAHSKIGTDGTH